jgi:hypothetical protein
MIRWRVAGALLTVMVLAFTSFGVWLFIAQGTETQRYSYARQISALTIDAGTADVAVVAGVPGRVDVVRWLDWSAHKPEVSERWEGDRLIIRVSCTNKIKPFRAVIECGAGYQLSAPPGIPVTVDSDGGDISVSKMTGELTLRTEGGNIYAHGSQGRVQARTDHGDIHVQSTRSTDVVARTESGNVLMDFLVPPTRAESETMAGDVVISVPSGTTYAVRTQNFAGSTDSRVPNDSGSPYKIIALSSYGNVSIKYGESLSAP